MPLERPQDYSPEEKSFMLKLARGTMERKLKRQVGPDVSAVPESLREIRSCFVTLHTRDGHLRGCIGNIGGFEPLAENIVHNAVGSAFRDPRFAPVSSPEELASLKLEISVLTQPEEIASIDGFIIGEHGIILAKGDRSAVFLPQVAPEQGWDVAATMENLSMKAGLHPGAWREPGAKFSVFRAIVFSEEDSAGR